MSDPRDSKWLFNFFVQILKGRYSGGKMTTSVSADSINTAVGSESRSSQLSTPSDRTLADNLPGTAAVSDVAENEENEAQLKGYAAAGFVTALPYVLYALGVAWVLLFPLVTITTGEAKPRGTFVDENAMLIHHNSMDLRPVDVEWAHPSSLRKTYPPQVRTFIRLLFSSVR